MEIDDELKSNISSADTWLRLLLIILFGVLTSVVVMPVVWVLAGMQFLFTLFTGSTNDNLQRIHLSLVAWLGQVFSYMLYVSDRKPFPLSDLPDVDGQSGAEASTGAETARPKPKKPAKSKPKDKEEPAQS